MIQTPLLLSMKFFVTRIFRKHIRVALHFFSVLWDKNFSIEISDMPFLCTRFFDTRIFLKQKVSPTKFFGRVRKKTFDWNRDCNSFSHLFINFFDTSFFSETQKVSRAIFFDIVRRQVFDGNLWFPLFLLSLNFIDSRNFLKYRRDHIHSFSALWDKRFPTDVSDIPFLCKRCFDTRIFLKHGKGSLQIFSALWD